MSARGCDVAIATSEDELKRCLRRAVGIVVYDHHRSHDFGLNPRLFGYEGYLLFLCDAVASRASMEPFFDAVLLKPVDLEQLVQAALDGLGERRDSD